jgi:hypothetical protein
VTYALNQGEPFVTLNKKADVTKGVFDLATVAQGVTTDEVPQAAPAPQAGGLRGLARMVGFGGRATPAAQPS